MPRHPYEIALDELCIPLQLERDGQHWAVEVSSPTRIDEFIRFYEEHPWISEMAKQMLFELIIASMSDALQESRGNFAFLAKYSDFVRREADAYPGVMGYWSTGDMSEKDWFDIAPWLREVTGRTWERIAY